MLEIYNLFILKTPFFFSGPNVTSDDTFISLSYFTYLIILTLHYSEAAAVNNMVWKFLYFLLEDFCPELCIWLVADEQLLLVWDQVERV